MTMVIIGPTSLSCKNVNIKQKIKGHPYEVLGIEPDLQEESNNAAIMPQCSF